MLKVKQEARLDQQTHNFEAVCPNLDHARAMTRRGCYDDGALGVPESLTGVSDQIQGKQ
jgi:hypothetical protein